MKAYDFTIYDNYMLVKINDDWFTIDTGCPYSFSFKHSLNRMNISRDYIIRYNPMPESINQRTFGRIISGIIGNDILFGERNIIFDKTKNKVFFGGEYEITENDCKMPLNSTFKYNLRINEKDCIGYLDTGAHYVMVDDHSLLEGARIKDSYIESSFTGDLKTDRYEGSISFGNKHSDSTYMLKSVQNMNRCPGIQVFFGVCNLFTERCVFDFENKILLLK